jgi:hypothetical protein
MDNANVKYKPGIAFGHKDVFGRPCPAVIMDGDTVLCLFPGSRGSQQAVDFCNMMNKLVGIVPASLLP